MKLKHFAITASLALLGMRGILGTPAWAGGDTVAPGAKIRFSTEDFSPPDGKTGEPLVVTIQAPSGAARIVSWDMTVFDPGDMPFISFKGVGPRAEVAWDGRGVKGDLVESASQYTFVARIRDALGNVGETRATLTTGIVLLKGSSRYRIGISSIVFKPDTADFRDVEPAQVARNLETLRLLAAKLKLFPGYRIRIEGHAVLTNWQDKAKAEAEQRNSLIPLSKARSEAIKAALVKYSIPASAMETAGLGAKDPIVPDSDVKNRWKNRRVEIYLEG
jgi:hypothetical protein